MQKLPLHARLLATLAISSAGIIGLNGCSSFNRTFGGTSDDIATATAQAEYHQTARDIKGTLAAQTDISLVQPFNSEVYKFCRNLENAHRSQFPFMDGCDEFFASRKVASVADVQKNFEYVDQALQQNTDRFVTNDKGKNNWYYSQIASDTTIERDSAYAQLLSDLRETIIKAGTQTTASPVSLTR